MDMNFLVLSSKIMCISPFNIRRDPDFSAQFYFIDFQRMPSSNKFGLYLSHLAAASASELDQSVRLVTFLKRKTSSALRGGDDHSVMPDMSLAIDERAAKLYISFNDNITGTETKLRVIDIQFEPADHLGYRRLRVQEQDRLFVVKVPPPVPSTLGPIKISMVTGNVFCQYFPHIHRSNTSTVARFEAFKAKNSVIRVRTSEHKFTTLDQRASMFTKLDHLLILYGFRQMDKPQKNKSMCLLSYDADLNLVRSLEFNPAQLVNKFLATNVMFHFYESQHHFSSESAAAGSCLDIVGHMHKYVFFSFDEYILAVKWPRDWYMRKNLPPIQLSRVIDMQDFIDNVEDCREIDPLPMALTDTHLYIAFCQRDKTNEIKRVFLSPRFKDNRHCANCGEVEKRKRRNKEGKRIAMFKVCRLCKKKNFHLFYLDSEIACHYCSVECQKKHWKEHKDVHKRSKMNRKTASAKTVEEKF